MLTLHDIKAEQNRIASLIAAYEAQPIKWEAPITLTFPDLMPGEKWAGIVIGVDGRKHHIILLPDRSGFINWKSARDWAAALGGELPDRVEGALLFAVMPDEFEKEWHWTREQRAANADYAWCQYFGNGFQGDDHKDVKLRARAVRRLPI